MKQSSRILLKSFIGASLLTSVLLLFNGCHKEAVKPLTNHLENDSSTYVPLPCGAFTTYTQGGWGAAPHGNNPGSYLHANFAGAFPSGLIVGCTKTITFTSAQAITDYLPDGGAAAVLSQNYVNPVGLKNVLAAQVVTLTLSVQFDAYDPNFGGSSGSLGSLVIASGPFTGWTVKNILAEANKVLGGCASTFTLTQMVDAITAINENFDNGNTNKGFLKCPSEVGGSVN